MSHLNKLQNEYGDQGLTVIAFNGQESKEAVLRFCLTNGVQYKVFVDAGITSRDMSGGTVPRCYVLDPEGKMIWNGHPDKLSGDKIEEFLRQRNQLLNEKFKTAPRTAVTKLIQNKKGDAYKSALSALKNEKDAEKKKAAQELIDFLEDLFNKRLEYAVQLYDKDELVQSKIILDQLQKELKGTNSKLLQKVEEQLKVFDAGDVKNELKTQEMVEGLARKFMKQRNGKNDLQKAAIQFRNLATQKKIAGSMAAEKAEFYAKVFDIP